MPCYIYKFEHENDSYIGSTKDFTMRGHAHQQHRKQTKYNHYAIYQYANEKEIPDIREHITILYETIDDLTKDERRNLEQDFMDIHKPTLNMCNAMKR